MILEGKEEISKYLPQREPILMVDKLIDINDNGCEDALTVSANSIFVKDGAILDAALIEHTAQSGALFIGFFKASVVPTEAKNLRVIIAPGCLARTPPAWWG